jgi:phospholipid-binding lipoprotein MlaA
MHYLYATLALVFLFAPPAKALENISQQEKSEEINDPIEPVNRGIFWVNGVLDYFFIERISEMYRGVVPQYSRERVAYALRNLNEPVVFANNLLQGEIDDAAITMGRFVVNTTLGLAGIFDVATDLGLQYKKADFGLTLASWGFETGPYIVLPILGPSNLRDGFGRIGDYAFDPINWVFIAGDLVAVPNCRSGTSILDAKTDNLDLLAELRDNSLDEYATIRAWYTERRKDLMLKVEERRSSDSPRPDDDD